jgi:FlaA1/EpsC-like NDP-sugar epimerase
MKNEDNNKVILITGAAGSVGKSLVKFYLRAGYKVRGLDNSEDGLFNLEKSLDENITNFRPLLGDIRDIQRVEDAMRGVNWVIHCAACKHVYINEYNPLEAVNTNVLGTDNIIRAAINKKVERVLLTSSDKAVNPTSTMGASKLLAERTIIAANNISGESDTIFSIVRFGNILNSNGSVLHIFRNFIEEKKPIPITSTKMTRFFLRMIDAVELCHFAISNMIGGEIFVRSMGSADILTLAKAYTGDPNVNHSIIGLKPGEKLYEELVTEQECERTYVLKEYLVVLPEIKEFFKDKVKEKLLSYESLPKMESDLRSDKTCLTDDEMIKLIN